MKSALRSSTVLAVALVAAAGAAQAETTLFGRAGAAVANLEPVLKADGGHAWGVFSDDSFLGVQGSEDLGGGLSAIYFLKFAVQLNGSATGNPFYQSESWVGAKGGFGQLTAGLQSGAYDNLIDSSGLFDFTGTPFQLDPGSTSNTLRYDSPKWAGFSLSAAATLDGSVGPDTRSENGVDLWSASALYKAHGIRAGVSYMANRNVDTDLIGVDLRYGTPDFQIGGTYEHGDLSLLGGLPASLTGGISGVLNPIKGMESTGWGIAGQYNLGNNVLLVHGGRRTSDYVFTELDEYAVGVQHWFSKRTHAYVEYEYIDRKLDTLNNNSTLALGLRTDF